MDVMSVTKFGKLYFRSQRKDKMMLYLFIYLHQSEVIITRFTGRMRLLQSFPAALQLLLLISFLVTGCLSPLVLLLLSQR
jgi:hypothetical protein